MVLKRNRELSKQDKRLCHYFVMTNRLAFREKYMPIATGKYYKTRFYQVPPALVDDCVVYGGRSIGKSYDLEISIIQTILNVPKEESVLTAFRKTHIRDREERVITYIQQVPYFKLFFKGTNRTARDSVSRSPVYCITLRNGHQHFGISIGDDPAAVMIQGHHPTHRFGEEFQFYPDSAWQKWQSTQDPRGSVDRYYGTVDGRIETPFRKLDGGVDKFKNNRFHVPQVAEPYFNQEKKRNAIETFGGKDANEYLQQILALWGEPLWGVWDEKAISECINKVEDPKYAGLLANRLKVIEITGKSYKSLTPAQALHDLPKLPKEGLDVILGIDAGYTSRTVILPFFFYENKWQLRCRIMVKDKVIADDQAEIIDHISDFYGASVISIDCTSSEGKAPADSLCNVKNKQYANKNYSDRILWVEFNKKMTISYKTDGTEVEDTVKNATTGILYQMFDRQEFDIWFDEEILGDFNRETKRQNVTGSVSIITPPDVHIPEAFRCFAFGYFLKRIGAERPQVNHETSFQFPIFKNAISGLFGRG